MSQQSLRPVYAESPPITSKWIREKIKPLLPFCDYLPGIIPDFIKEEKGLWDAPLAIKTQHAPPSVEAWHESRQTLAFTELFEIQLKVYALKKAKTEGPPARFSFAFDPEAIKSDLKLLPFTLTEHQKIALFQVLKDFGQTKPMARLLQGDVGSGKTIVALLAGAEIIRQGGQVTLMAPTEILARQHFSTIINLFPDLRTELLIGAIKESEKKKIREKIASGMTQMVVGTHAIITDKTEFHSLGLAVIDEQHRFGVKQRAVLSATGGACA